MGSAEPSNREAAWLKRATGPPLNPGTKSHIDVTRQHSLFIFPKVYLYKGYKTSSASWRCSPSSLFRWPEFFPIPLSYLTLPSPTFPWQLVLVV